MSSRVYRMADSQLPAVLATLAASGSTARTPQTWAQDAMTALVLGDDHAIDALMPLARRDLRVGAGPTADRPRVLKAGWLSANQFASRMGLRRQTRSSAGQWAEMLPDVEALLAMLRDTGAPLVQRWYQHVGFHPVLSVRCLYLDMLEAPPTAASRYHVQVLSIAEAEALQPQMLEVHRDVFANAGGMVLRHPTFWHNALTHHFYGEHYQFQIVALLSGQSLMGYAVIGWSGWHSKRPRMDVLEIATRQWDQSVSHELILTTSQLAWSKNVHQVRAVISAHDPYRGHLGRLGFKDLWGYSLLAKWLHPQKFIDRALSDVQIAAQIAVPGRVPLKLGATPAAGATAAELHTDEATLTKLLLNRIELPVALADGSIKHTAALSSRQASELSAALPYTPWVFHMLDYI